MNSSVLDLLLWVSVNSSVDQTDTGWIAMYQNGFFYPNLTVAALTFSHYCISFPYEEKALWPLSLHHGLVHARLSINDFVSQDALWKCVCCTTLCVGQNTYLQQSKVVPLLLYVYSHIIYCADTFSFSGLLWGYFCLFSELMPWQELYERS